jgi:hypothetical protein
MLMLEMKASSVRRLTLKVDRQPILEIIKEEAKIKRPAPFGDTFYLSV